MPTTPTYSILETQNHFGVEDGRTSKVNNNIEIKIEELDKSDDLRFSDDEIDDKKLKIECPSDNEDEEVS